MCHPVSLEGKIYKEMWADILKFFKRHMWNSLLDSEPDRDEGEAQDEAIQRARRLAQQRLRQPPGAVRGRQVQGPNSIEKNLQHEILFRFPTPGKSLICRVTIQLVQKLPNIQKSCRLH